MQDFQRGTVGANVLVSFEASAVDFIFKKSSDFGDFTTYVKGHPEAYLFGYQSPRNIVSFEHSYGYRDGGAGGNAPTFVIKFIDPEVEFENRFLKHASMEGMAMEAFSVDLDELKTKDDFLDSPYSDWYQDAYGENFDAVKEENDAKTDSVLVGYTPDYAGRTTWPRRLDWNGSPPNQNPNKNRMVPFGHYQIKLSDAVEDASGGWRYSDPIKCRITDAQGSNVSKPYLTECPPDYIARGECVSGEIIQINPKMFPGAWAYRKEVFKGTDKTKYEKEVEDATAKQLNEYIESERKKLGAGSVTKLYVAYGMGSDFSTWAGPFQCIVMDATNEYDTMGVRTLTLTLVAGVGDLGSGQREGALGSGFGKKANVEREISIKDFNRFGQGTLKQRSSEYVSDIINVYEQNYGKGFAEAWKKEHSGELNKNFGTDDTKQRPYRFVEDHIPGDIHLILRSLLTDFAHAVASQGQVPKGNIVVLLPNLDIGLAELQKTILADVLQSDAVRENNEGRHWDGTKTGLYSQADLDSSEKEYIKTNINPQLSYADSEVSLKTVWGYQVIKTLIESLGFDFTMVPRSGEERASDKMRVTHADNLCFSANKELDPNDSFLGDPGGGNENWSDSLIHFFGRALMPGPNQGKTRLKYAISLSNKFEEDFEETLYRILRDLEANTTIQIGPKVIWEQDRNILKLLETYGVIATADEPALLIGSETMINHFIYGHLIFMETFHEDTAITDFLKYVHPADSERFSVRNDEPMIVDEEDRGKSDFFPYCRDVFHYIYGVGGGAFNKTFEPTELDIGEKSVQDLVAAGVPMFRSGYPNSNILSMKMDLKPYYLAGLSFNFIAEQGRSHQRGTGAGPDPKIKKDTHPDTVNKGGLSPDQINKLLELENKTAFDLNDDTLSKLSNISKEMFGFSINRDKDGDSQDYNNFMHMILGIIGSKNNSGVTMTVPEQGGVNAFESVKRMVDFISKQTIQGAVKTLPYFRLSGVKATARPVIMNVREVRMAGVKGNTSAFTTAIYSGFWNLWGFKHVITNREAFSEFTLIKQPGMSPASYKKVTELTEKQEAALLEASLETGEIFTAGDSLNAAAQGGSLVNNLTDKIQPMNQPTSPGPEFINLQSYGGAWDAGDLDE